MYEKKIANLSKQVEDKHSCAEHAVEEVRVMKKLLNDHQKPIKVCTLEINFGSYSKASSNHKHFCPTPCFCSILGLSMHSGSLGYCMIL